MDLLAIQKDKSELLVMKLNQLQSDEGVKQPLRMPIQIFGLLVK